MTWSESDFPPLHLCVMSDSWIPISFRCHLFQFDVRIGPSEVRGASLWPQCPCVPILLRLEYFCARRCSQPGLSSPAPRPGVLQLCLQGVQDSLCRLPKPG